MDKFYKYKTNVTTIKKYGENYVKLQTMNVQRTPFTEHENSDIDNFSRLTNNKSVPKKITKDYNKIRLEESIIRTRRLIFEYAISNNWDYFCTFTIDKSKYDRFDLNYYHKSFSQWIRDYFRKKLRCDVQYILIPEQHKDGAWHEHGLFKNIPLSELSVFDYNSKLPYYIRDKISKNEKIYNCPAYLKKFGFCTFEPVRNSEACAKYITKYITKDIVNSSIDFGNKLYYVSRNLKKAENICIGEYNGVPFYDFVNDYCKMSTFSYSDEFLKTLVSKIIKL